jgi:hypothetical protein
VVAAALDHREDFLVGFIASLPSIPVTRRSRRVGAMVVSSVDDDSLGDEPSHRILTGLRLGWVHRTSYVPA